MDIHEYQAKEILSRFGVTVPPGGLAYSPEQAAYRARELGGNRWIVKAQVHAGGRGKAGGVKLCASENEIHEATNAMFGRKLVTHQTGPEGKPVQRVYVEVAEPFERELYLGIVLDPAFEDKMVRFVRAFYLEFNTSPAIRALVKAMEKQYGPEKGNSRYLYKLFPEGPAKQATKIGGLPKPVKCI